MGNMTTYTTPRRTLAEKFRDSYALIRVAVARRMRGEKMRLRTLFR